MAPYMEVIGVIGVLVGGLVLAHARLQDAERRIDELETLVQDLHLADGELVIGSVTATREIRLVDGRGPGALPRWDVRVGSTGTVTEVLRDAQGENRVTAWVDRGASDVAVEVRDHRKIATTVRPTGVR